MFQPGSMLTAASLRAHWSMVPVQMADSTKARTHTQTLPQARQSEGGAGGSTRSLSNWRERVFPSEDTGSPI